MKIFQLVQKPQRRGAEIFAFQLSRELRRQGHKVQIAYLYPHQDAKALPLHPEDQMLSGQERHPLEKFPGFHPRPLRRLLQLIEQFRPDVVQVNGSRTVKYGAFARHFCRNGSWVLIYRNIGNPQDWVRGWSRRLFYEKLVMPKINGVVGVSSTTLKNLSDFYLLSIPAIHIPRGVDSSALKPMTSREATRQKMQISLRSPLLLFVGSLTPEKRLDRLLRVAGQVRAHLPDLRLCLVGDGPLRAKLEQQVAALGLTNTVYFAGMQADVATYMNAADLLLLTSDTEGTPGVILEAGLLRLPVVATRVGGVPECVLHKKTGLLADPDDEIGLAQAVIMLLQRPEERYKMGERSEKWIQANFTIGHIAQKYIDFYQQVLVV